MGDVNLRTLNGDDDDAKNKLFNKYGSKLASSIWSKANTGKIIQDSLLGQLKRVT